MEAYQKIARILRADKDVVNNAAAALAAVVGHDDALQRIAEENDNEMAVRLDKLGIRESTADRIYDALIRKVKDDDAALSDHFGNPACDSQNACGDLLDAAKDLANVPPGFFLKEEKARDFLLREPPPRTLSFFKLSRPEDLIWRFGLFEIYSALRFVEEKEWLNNIFFKQLESVTAADFEERAIELKVLNPQWLAVAEKFLSKKFHNVSHLKELGVIFVIPLKIDTAGETMRLFGLLLHYLHEVTFYSGLFRKFAKEEDSEFAAKLISSLRGDVLDRRFAEGDQDKKWMIVQQYLAKEDPFDWRLFQPHINPEALHWSKAEDDIARFGKQFPDLDFSFWHRLDHVGDYFRDLSGAEVLISMNLIDTVMSLVQQKEMVKYLYHHQEALWNRIFAEYVGHEKMEECMVKNFEKGYIDIRTMG